MGNRESALDHAQEEGTGIRERVGLVVPALNAANALQAIIRAEAAGVQQVWAIQTAFAPDTLSTFAAAAVRTAKICLGTAIVPTYPRHPLALAQQALTLHDLAPGRLRLGIGPSHRPTIEGVFGIPMAEPLEHLREYATVLRALLYDGNVDHQGRFYRVKAQLPRTPRTPILVSALREKAFRQAGEISDGAISWLCPASYLLKKALPALRKGAAESGRPVPPLLAHVPVALSTNRQAVISAARKVLARYAQLPFYGGMFADAGFPVGSDGHVSDDLIDNLVVAGDEARVATRLKELLASGLDELLVWSVPVTDAEKEYERLLRVLSSKF